MLQTSVTTIATLSTIAVLTSCSAFLLADNCPAPSPCTCSGNTVHEDIRCRSKNLKEIPHLVQSRNNISSVALDLDGNSITVIHDNAFNNLRSFNAFSISLQLGFNHINTIENGAFNGIENVTGSLYLQHNNLATLPVAIGNLVSLHTLYIYENPLRSLGSSVMSKIGGSLTYLYFDMKYFTQWPQELHYLRNLGTLIARYVPFSQLNTSAFQGLDDRLLTLQLLYSKLVNVPSSICTLTKTLHELALTGSMQLNQNASDIFQACSGNFTQLTRLDLGSTGLGKFPNVFTSNLFPSLTELEVSYNSIKYINSAMIPLNTTLTKMNLDSNQLDRIPTALNNLQTLKSLHIALNDIKTIEPFDLYGLPMLNDLEINGNPLVYISPDAFKHNMNLETLNIRNTHLVHVPEAVTKLPKLRIMFVSPMRCTCDMPYLKHWNVNALTMFYTKCVSSSKTIKTFIVNYSQSCP